MGPELTVGIILYHPTARELAAVAAAAAAPVRLCLHDNGGVAAPLPAGAGVTTLGDGANVGVSRALNAILRHAFADGGSAHLLILDQDSLVDWALLADVWPMLRDRLEQGAVLQLAEGDGADIAWQSTPLIINSGLLIPRAVWSRVGPMDESFFVDGSDYAYSLRLHLAGVTMERVVVPGLFDHSSQQAGRSVRFFGRRVWIRNYGRRYRGIYRGGLRLIGRSLAAREAGYALLFAKALAVTAVGHLMSRVLQSENSERTSK